MIADAIGLVVSIALSVFALGISFIALLLGRNRNFIAAWNAVCSRLQEKNLREGRRFLRFLHSQSKPSSSTGDKRRQAIPEEQWLKEYQHLLESDEPAKTEVAPDNGDAVSQLVENAYDEFEIAGIMILHSGVSTFLNIFVVEYNSGIIACWEQGIPVFKRQLEKWFHRGGNRPDIQTPSRITDPLELYQCFSCLYVTARYMQKINPRQYPHFSFLQGSRLFLWRYFTMHRKAQKERQRLLLS